jgi:hypothetical protein
MQFYGINQEAGIVDMAQLATPKRREGGCAVVALGSFKLRRPTGAWLQDL